MERLPGETNEQFQNRLAKKRYDDSLFGGLVNMATPIVDNIMQGFTDLRQKNLARTDQTLQSYGYVLTDPNQQQTPTSAVNEVSIGEAGIGRGPKNKTGQKFKDSINNIMKSSNNVADNENNNDASQSSTTQDKAATNENRVEQPKNEETKAEETKVQENNQTKTNTVVPTTIVNNKTTGSRTRMGLFGNYGKDVKKTKTYDPSTGKITRQKFVDGEEVDRTKRGFKGVRRAKRAGNFGRRQRNRNNQNTSNKSTFNFGGGGNPFSVL